MVRRRLSGRLAGVMRPRAVAILLGDLRPRRPRSDVAHLSAVMAWLRRAQDACGGRGVAARYDVAAGWEPAYPETTGYIVPTLLHHAELFDEESSRGRARELGDWLLSVQATDGSISAGLDRDRDSAPSRPEAFNTGQVLFGLLALGEATGDERYLDGARRAACWLVDVQDEAGCWTRFSLHGAPHTYYARVAWALARAGLVLDEPRFRLSARRAVDWVCDQQQGNGWIEHMSFTPGTSPLTHTIAYTIEGLLETALLQPNGERAWAAAVQASRALQNAYCRPGSGARLRRAGHLAATFRPDWTSDDGYACVTGSVQLALCCRRIDAADGQPGFGAFADTLIESAKSTQPFRFCPADVRGGVPGSAPLWGAYASFRYLNWAAKFMADALMDRLVGGLPVRRFG